MGSGLNSVRTKTPQDHEGLRNLLFSFLFFFLFALETSQGLDHYVGDQACFVKDISVSDIDRILHGWWGVVVMDESATTYVSVLIHTK